MSSPSNEVWSPTNPSRLAARFINLGKAGFWVQLILLIIAMVLAVSALRIGSSGSSGATFGIANLVSFLTLALPVFTTLWVRHYSGLGHRIEDPETRPSLHTLSFRLWVGIWAGSIGGVLSLIFLFGAVANLLYVLLTTPQVGLLVAPAAGGDALSVSAIDAVSLMSLLIALTADLLVVALSAWLMHSLRMASRDEETA